MISRSEVLHAEMLIVCAFVLLAGFSEAATNQNDEKSQTKDSKPNIIIILADDMVITINLIQFVCKQMKY